MVQIPEATKEGFGRPDHRWIDPEAQNEALLIKRRKPDHYIATDRTDVRKEAGKTERTKQIRKARSLER
jgi:hypothetical protein